MSTKKHFAPAAFDELRSDALECLLSAQELAFLAGTTPEIIEQLAGLDLIEPCVKSETVMFKTKCVDTVRKILRLRRHLQLGFDSMALVFDLLDRIDYLERRINELEKE